MLGGFERWSYVPSPYARGGGTREPPAVEQNKASKCQKVRKTDKYLSGFMIYSISIVDYMKKWDTVYCTRLTPRPI